MAKRNFDQEIDSFANPKSLRIGSVFLFLASLVFVFCSIELLLCAFPVGGKLAVHWGLDGKPNGWQSVGGFKAFARFFTLGIMVFIWVVLIASFYLPELYNPYRGFLIVKFPRLKKAKLWCIKNISCLSALAVNNVLLGLLLFSVFFAVLSANSSTEKVLRMFPHGISFIAPLLMYILFFLLWEPIRGDVKRRNSD